MYMQFLPGDATLWLDLREVGTTPLHCRRSPGTSYQPFLTIPGHQEPSAKLLHSQVTRYQRLALPKVTVPGHYRYLLVYLSLCPRLPVTTTTTYFSLFPTVPSHTATLTNPFSPPQFTRQHYPSQPSTSVSPNTSHQPSFTALHHQAPTSTPSFTVPCYYAPPLSLPCCPRSLGIFNLPYLTVSDHQVPSPSLASPTLLGVQQTVPALTYSLSMVFRDYRPVPLHSYRSTVTRNQPAPTHTLPTVHVTFHQYPPSPHVTQHQPSNSALQWQVTRHQPPPSIHLTLKLRGTRLAFSSLHHLRY